MGLPRQYQVWPKFDLRLGGTEDIVLPTVAFGVFASRRRVVG